MYSLGDFVADDGHASVIPVHYSVIYQLCLPAKGEIYSNVEDRESSIVK